MLIDDFLHGKSAMRVSGDIPYGELFKFQQELEDYAGHRIGWNHVSDGFAAYCVRIRAHVAAEEHIDEIEVECEGDRFEYMPGGTGWFIDRGVNVVPFHAYVDELMSLKGVSDVSIEDLEAVLD